LLCLLSFTVVAERPNRSLQQKQSSKIVTPPAPALPLSSDKIYVANVNAVSLILNLADLSPGHSNFTHSNEAAVVMFPERNEKRSQGSDASSQCSSSFSLPFSFSRGDTKVGLENSPSSPMLKS